MRRLASWICVSGALLGCAAEGGEGTRLGVHLYTTLGRAHEGLLEAGGPANALEIVTVRHPNPLDTQRNAEFSVSRGEGILRDLEAGTGYQIFVRGFPPDSAADKDVPQLFGGSVLFDVTDGVSQRVGIQVGRADCIGLNRGDDGNSLAGGAWDLNQARAGLTLTDLGDGNILVVGGATVGANGEVVSVSDTLEVYFPNHGQFVEQTALKLPEPRAYHTATRLSNGDVLLFGGLTQRGDTVSPSQTADLLSVSNGEVRVRALDAVFAADARWRHSATLLTERDGRHSVLIAGGLGPDGAPHKGTLRYFPSTGVGDGRFEPQGDLCTPRAFHTGSPIGRPNELAVVAGGQGANGDALDQMEIFTINSRQTGCCGGATPSAERGCFVNVRGIRLAERRFGHRAMPVDDGRQILFIGGYGTADRETLTRGLELLDNNLAMRSPDEVGRLAVGRGDFTATGLRDGSILLTGGRRGSVPVADASRLLPRRAQDASGIVGFAEVDLERVEGGASCSLSESHADHTAIPLVTGTVLIAGGVTGVPGDQTTSRRVELYFPRVLNVELLYGR